MISFRYHLTLVFFFTTILAINGETSKNLRFFHDDKTQKRVNQEVIDLYDVIIIGAGWSGLGAAKTLQKQGVENFIVLEAHDYIGGRSKTSTFPGTDVKFEEGTYALNNADDNGIYEFMKENNLPSTSIVYSYDIIYDDGESYENANKIFYEHSNGIYGYWDQNWNDLTSDSSMSDVVKGYTSKFDDPETIDIINAVANVSIDYEYAADPDLFSAKFGNNNVNYTAFNVTPDDGFSSVVELYAESFSSQIRMNAKVTRVKYNENPAEVTYVDKNGDTIVLKGKRVLVTLPLGVLKAGTVEFDPPFSENGWDGRRKQRAIDNMDSGRMEKIAIYFQNMTEDEIFWNKETDLTLVVAGESQGNYTFLHNGISKGHQVLYCYVTGVYVDNLVDKSDNEIIEEFIERLRLYYGDSNVPDPSHYFVSNWMTDEFTRGIYAYATVGANRGVREDMVRPLNGRLFFAGEHTIESRLGSAHGAILSGILAATNLRKLAFRVGFSLLKQLIANVITKNYRF